MNTVLYFCRHIDKSKPYFEQKTTFNKALNSEKNRKAVNYGDPECWECFCAVFSFSEVDDKPSYLAQRSFSAGMQWIAGLFCPVIGFDQLDIITSVPAPTPA